jgi:hypothetical protein
LDDGPSHTVRQNGTGARANGTNGTQKVQKRAPGKLDLNAISHTIPNSNSTTPLINLEMPPNPSKPPLPPRKQSYNSLKSVSSFNTTGGSSGTSLQPPNSPHSLTVDHTYPPLSKLDAPQKSHAPASSISSFHSVSLSSDGGTAEHILESDTTQSATFSVDHEVGVGDDGDSISLGESFENVSASSVISPTAVKSIAKDWEKAMAKRKAPPKLPQRPSSRVSAPSTPANSLPTSPKTRSAAITPNPHPQSTPSPSSTITNARRAPPPPPPPRSLPQSSRASLTSTSASDRSSVLSTATSTSRTSINTRFSAQIANKQPSLTRPTPVPAAAKKRYEAVFELNILQRRRAEKLKPARMSHLEAKKGRQAAGWRGLSIDLITNPHPMKSPEPIKSEELDVDKAISSDERLEGSIVHMIWSWSNLEKGKLRSIW